MDKATRREVRHGMARLAGLALLLLLLFAFLPFRGDYWWLSLLIGFCVVVAIVPITVRRAQSIPRSRMPLFAAAESILLIVAMLVFAFASIYLTIDRDAGQFDGLVSRLDAVYFTVVTLSTVGFGDIHAAGQAARTAVTLQIVLDLSLLAMAVRLLSSAARRAAHIEERTIEGTDGTIG